MRASGLQNIVNYALLPERRKVVYEEIKKAGGASPSQMKEIAQRENVALKAIHKLMEDNKLPIKSEKEAEMASSKSFAELPKMLEQLKAEAQYEKERDRMKVFLSLGTYEQLKEKTGMDRFFVEYSDGILFVKPHSDGVAGYKYGNANHVIEVRRRGFDLPHFHKQSMTEVEVDEKGLRILMPERCVPAVVPQATAGTTPPQAPSSGAAALPVAAPTAQRLAAAIAKVNALVDDNVELYVEEGRLRARVTTVQEI